MLSRFTLFPPRRFSITPLLYTSRLIKSNNSAQSLIRVSLTSNRKLSTSSSLFTEAKSKSTGKKDTKIPSKFWPKLKNFTTFTFSAALVVGAIGISTIVIYLIGSELLSPSGDTQLFNRAVSMVQKDEKSRQLLQSNDSIVHSERLKAYGELITHDRWTRSRPIVSKRRIDQDGNIHCFLRFHIESKKKIGLVHCEALEKKDKIKPEFISLYVDISGEKRHFIIKPKLKKTPKATGFLGVNWGPKKN